MTAPEAHDGDIKDWSEIAKKIPGRSNKDCRKRFLNEVTGGLKKVRLTKASSHPKAYRFLILIPGSVDERRRCVT